MKACPYCGQQNREGILFCEECGQPFSGKQVESLATNRLLDEDASTYAGRPTWGTARFDRSSSIIIRLRDFSQPLSIAPKDELLIGRSDENMGQTLDLDLGPYGAAEKGVSRRHAAIRRGEDTLTLIDLGSTNGTHLNGQRLNPHQPRVLRDGDEIRMGKLVFHIFFK